MEALSMKRKFALLLTLLLLLTGFPLFAQADSSDFTISNGVLTGYSGLGGAVTIPSGVTGIGANAFQYCGEITSVEIPSGVTSIGSYAFRGCEALRSVTIANTVSSIGSNAFEDCISLTNVALPTSLRAIPDYAFADCLNLSEVYIPYGVTSIGNYAFSGCVSLTSLSVPYSVSSLSKTAFVGCDNLTNLSLPSRFNTQSGSIGSTAAWSLDSYGCLTITGSGVLSVSEIPWLAYKDSVRSVVIGSGITGIGDVFAHHNKITSVSLPGTLTAIGDSAFLDCSSLTSIAFPNSLKSIGANAFHGCSALSSITYGSGLTSIGLQAFSDCTSLSSLTLPESVMTIGDAAYSGCSSLTTAYIPSSTGSIGRNIFIFCPRLTRVNVNSSNAAYCGVDGILYNKSKTEVICCPAGKSGSVTLDANVTTIAPQAFFGCSGITSVTAGTALNEIDGYAFGYCTSLSSITLPDSVALIDGTAFHGCSALFAKVGKNSYAETFCKNHGIPYAYTVPTVISASFDGDAVVGRPVGVTVETLTSASYVKMFSEAGAAAAVWSSGYTDSGTRRVWHLKYTFSGAGDRKLTFKASSDNSIYGNGAEALVKVRVQRQNDVLNASVASGYKPYAKTPVTVVTPIGAVAVRMYDENGIQLAEWTDGYTDADSKRTWNVTYAFETAGTHKIVFKASTDGKEYGDGLSVSGVTAMPGANDMLYAAFASDAKAGVPVSVTIKTSTSAKYVTMYSEGGVGAKTWTSGYTDNSGVRTWKVEYTFTGPGNRSLTFKASTDKTTYGNGVTANVNVAKPGATEVLSAAFGAKISADRPNTITVVTSTQSKYLSVYVSKEGETKVFTGNYKDNGCLRTWTIEYTFDCLGSTGVLFRASTDGSTYGTALEKSITVSECEPDVVFSAAFDGSAKTGCPISLFVTTPTGTKSVALCSENGSVVGVWKNGYSDSGRTRKWELEYCFVGAGNRKLSVKASGDGSNYGANYPVNVTVVESKPNEVFSAVFDNSVVAGETATLTVVTPTSSKYVRLCTESGGNARTWTSGYTDSGKTRTWNLSYSFVNAGSRNLSVMASGDNSDYGSGVQVHVEVCPAVNTAVFASNVTVGMKAKLTVTTSTAAKYIRVSDENGNVLTTATTGYVDANGVRTWSTSVTLTDGSHSCKVAASCNGSNYGSGKTVSVMVYPSVISAAFDNAYAGENVSVRVVTTTGAKYISMYAEDGGRAATWSSGYTDSGSQRIWNISYKFVNGGNRTLTFKASADNSAYGEGVAVKVNLLPRLSEASFTESAVVGIPVTLRVVTSTAAKYVTLYAENGGLVKKWSSGYTDSGTQRTWLLSYTFSGTGYRKLTVKASADGTNFTSALAVNEAVNPVVPVVNSAAFTQSTVQKGTAVGICVTTSSNAKKLALCSESGSVCKVWSADGNSTVSGNVRTWNVSYAFGGAGNRSIGFQASADSSTYGGIRSAAITVTN